MRNDNGATTQAAAFVLAFGILGGAALITAVSLSRRGPIVFLPYAAIVLVCAALLRAERVQRFGRRFALHFGAFMASSVVLYVFIGQFQAHTLTKISAQGHAWRLAVIAGIGSVVSLAVAQLTATRTTAS
jgi:drug/metabolite transporter superfamily protein YnfA